MSEIELILKVQRLEDDCKAYNFTLHVLQEKIKELEAQIEKMKCCGNCANLCGCGFHDYEECKNLDKWELREIKEE